jgi:hypothetical protein
MALASDVRHMGRLGLALAGALAIGVWVILLAVLDRGRGGRPSRRGRI